MFKRANKITSLLVAAAAVVSLVPVTGASAAEVKKISSEDGIIYDAVAYKDGSAIIDGEVEDNDGAYYLADGKYTELDDVDSGATYAAYGTKYANVDDGDYFVDLETGTVTDDDVVEDDQDDAASALRKEIKDADRYGDDKTTIAALTLIPGNKFGESWYSTNDYNIAVTANNGVNPSIYTDSKGAYIDADYNLGKIKVETTGTAATATATIENTVDSEDLTYNNVKFATVNAKIDPDKNIELGQDADNIYRYAEIKITLAITTAGTNAGITLPSTLDVNGKTFDLDSSDAVTLKVIQKISKTQDSDDIDDAMYSKSVTNYVISDDGADLEDNDAKNYLALATADGTEARVIGGKLALFNVIENKTDGDNVEVQTATLKSKNGYYYTDLEESTTIQAEVNGDLDKTAADTDVDGNIYVLDGGYVKVFDGTDDWNKVYKVDGSFDGLSVYDKDNMVVWSQGDEVYSVIGGTTTTDDDTTVETPVVTAGWAQAANGTWTYNKADGTKATGWLQLGSAWYYLKADGVMATGWVLDGATWYYLGASGAMTTGWLNDNGTWYYLNANGSMAANTTVGGYVLGASGAWVK